MTSRRTAAGWGVRAAAPTPLIDVLIPTSGRLAEPAVVLAGLAGQDDPPFRVTISDQSEDHAVAREPSVQAMLRVLEVQGRAPRVLRHLPRHYLSGTELTDLASLEEGEHVAVMARVASTEVRHARSAGRGPGQVRLEVVLTDGRGRLNVTFFGRLHLVQWWERQLAEGGPYVTPATIAYYAERGIRG